jgi:hypothetical protein
LYCIVWLIGCDLLSLGIRGPLGLDTPLGAC